MAAIPILNLPVAVALDGSEYIPLVQGNVTRRATVRVVANAALNLSMTAAIDVVINGVGSVINQDVYAYVEVPFECTITSATMLADQSGSIAVNVWKCSYAAFNPPTTPSGTDSITGTNPPTITASSKSRDSTLTGWTTVLSQGDILAFQVPAVSTNITRVTLSLSLSRVIPS